jgi:hypothetical protein
MVVGLPGQVAQLQDTHTDPPRSGNHDGELREGLERAAFRLLAAMLLIGYRLSAVRLAEVTDRPGNQRLPPISPSRCLA